MVTEEAVIAPQGELTPEMFPSDDLSVLVASWISVAVTKVTGLDATVQDAAAIEWIYGHAYRTVARRLALEPNTSSAEDISESIGADRIQFWEQMAELHETAFQNYAQTTTTSGNRPTRTVSTRVFF